METLTFLPRALLHVRVAGYHDNLDHEAVAALPDHVDDLPVTDLHHVLTVDLRHRGTQSSTACSTVYWLVEEGDSTKHLRLEDETKLMKSVDLNI